MKISGEIYERPLNNKDMAAFCHSLYILLRSGVSDIESIRILSESGSNRNIKKRAATLYKAVRKGRFIYQGLHEAKFPELAVSSVKAGEMNGRLEEVLFLLSSHFDRQKKLKAKLRQIMIYPYILLVMISAALVVVSVYVLPEFMEIFIEFGVEPPLLTKGLLAFSDLLAEYYREFAAAAALLIVFFLYSKKQRRLRFIFQFFALKLPVIKGIIMKIIFSRFTAILAIQLSGEVFLLNALEISERAVQNEVYARAIRKLRGRVGQGVPFERAMADEPLIPDYAAALLNAGSASGDYGEMLSYLSKVYDDEAALAVESAATLAETGSLIIVGAVVLLLAMAVIMPMYDVMDAISA